MCVALDWIRNVTHYYAEWPLECRSRVVGSRIVRWPHCSARVLMTTLCAFFEALGCCSCISIIFYSFGDRKKGWRAIDM